MGKEFGSVNLYCLADKYLIVPKVPPHGITVYHDNGPYKIFDATGSSLVALEAAVYQMLLMSMASVMEARIKYDAQSATKAFDSLMHSFSLSVGVSLPKLERLLSVVLVSCVDGLVTITPTHRGKGKFNFVASETGIVQFGLPTEPTFLTKLSEIVLRSASDQV